MTVKAEDATLYECNINEGDKVCLDVNNKLEKVAPEIVRMDGADLST